MRFTLLVTTGFVALAVGGLFHATHANAGPAGKVAVIESGSWAVHPGATWAWAPITTSSADPRIANDIMQARIRIATEQALAAKGLRQVATPGEASLLVSYHVSVTDKVEPKVSGGYPVGACGFRGCLRGFTAQTVEIDRFTEGALVLSLVERSTGRLAWRAASRKEVKQKDASQTRLNAVLVDMTKTLPAA